MRLVFWNGHDSWCEYITATAVRRLSSSKWSVDYFWRRPDGTSTRELQNIIVTADYIWMEAL